MKKWYIRVRDGQMEIWANTKREAEARFKKWVACRCKVLCVGCSCCGCAWNE